MSSNIVRDRRETRDSLLNLNLNLNLNLLR